MQQSYHLIRSHNNTLFAHILICFTVNLQQHLKGETLTESTLYLFTVTTSIDVDAVAQVIFGWRFEQNIGLYEEHKYATESTYVCVCMNEKHYMLCKTWMRFKMWSNENIGQLE